MSKSNKNNKAVKIVGFNIRQLLLLAFVVMFIGGVANYLLDYRFFSSENESEQAAGAIAGKQETDVVVDSYQSYLQDGHINLVGQQDLGAGNHIIDRGNDLIYTVQDGETLSEIAYQFNTGIETVAYYNNIVNSNLIFQGMQLRIPSLNNESKVVEQLAAVTSTINHSVPIGNETVSSYSLSIASDVTFDGLELTAHFFIPEDQDPGNLVSYEWDMGNGNKSFRSDTHWSYSKPGTYGVRLTTVDADGRAYRSPPLFVDVPHPGSYDSFNQKFAVHSDMDKLYQVSGEIVAVYNYSNPQYSPFSLIEVDQDGNAFYRIEKAGNYQITVQDHEKQSQVVFLTVDHSPAVHARYQENINWYRTQFNTGTPSNCGPSVVSMAVGWAKGEYVPVYSVRQKIGWVGDGGTSFPDLINIIREFGVEAKSTRTYSEEDIFSIIDNGNMAVILYNSGGVRRTVGGVVDNVVGRYYSDSVGHYVIIEGYTVDKRNFIVYDPIPSDWSSNSLRYDDGISMIGRNRYYPVDDVMRSLKRTDVIEIVHQ